jgi:tRNA U34 5-methylaminomethyl-2-thiouridine-forming methyltransferase MnmC
MMQREIIITRDGSHSIGFSRNNTTYHSRHGAIQESKHVYIETGLNRLLNQKPCIRVFEMGFGTGLNALLALISAEGAHQHIYYETIEPYPLGKEFFEKLNYPGELHREDLKTVFQQLHQCSWDKEISVSSFFTFKKIRTSLQDLVFTKSCELVFYDAFAPQTQPELWTEAIFNKLYAALVRDGLLVTYCSKGDVQRALKTAGFTLEKLPGPLYKREILRATKK